MSTTFHSVNPVTEARRFATRLTEQALAIEQHRSIPEQLVADLRQAGLFNLMTPASAGGLEAEPRAIIGAIEELTRADAATGWTVLIGQGAGFLAWLAPDVTARILDRHPRPIVVGSMAPLGLARPAAGTDRPALRITGRWPYSSGCQLADLVFGAFLPESANGNGHGGNGHGGNGAGGNGAPALPRFALFTPSQVDIHDTWRVAGLRGTGSHDLEARDVEVPLELTFDPFGPAREPGPLYRLPYLTFLMTAMAGFPLGAARRVVDEYAAVAKVKRTTERVLLAETPLARADLARCEAAVRAARAGVLEAADTVWSEAAAGVPSLRTRTLFIASVQHAMRTAVEVADAALHACGASQLYEQAPLQRYFRDIQAAAQHIGFGLELQRRVGAVLLDQELPAGVL